MLVQCQKPRYSGLNVGLILHTACSELNIDPVVRERTVDVLARHVEDALRYQREFGNRSKSVFLFALINVGKLYGAYVTIVYTFIKCLHLANVAFQFYLINTFLETADYPLFGGHVIYDLLRVRVLLRSLTRAQVLSFRVVSGATAESSRA